MQKKQDKLVKMLIKFLFCELFACVFMVAVSNSINVTVTTASVLMCTVLTTLVFYVVSCFSQVYKVFCIVLFSALGIGLITFVVLVLTGVLPAFGDLFQMLMDRALSTEKLTETQQLGVIYGITVTISFFSVFFISKKINVVALSIATFVFYAIQFASTKNRASMGAFAVLIYILVVIALYKVFEFFEAKSGAGFGYKRFAVFGIAGVMCILVAVASAVAPFEENSFSKKFSLERFSNDTFVDNGIGSYYIAWSGVGYDDAALGGPRGALDFESTLKITSDYPTYIVANYSDRYTGNAFELSTVFVTGKYRYHEKGADPYDSSKIPMNTLLKTAAFDAAGLSYAQNPITLTYQGKMDFRTIFTANGLTYIENPHKRTIWSDPCDNMYTNQYMRKNFDYSFDSVYFDVDSVLSYLRSDAYTGKNPAPNVINQTKLTEYEKNAYNTYLSLPDSVPDRVRALSEKIVAESESTARIDQVWSLMTYLYQFKYKYATAELPDGRDFVDYFLFDEKGGYSTYFAAALTVMCRELGIPARYVKGFAPLAEAGEDKLICNNSAHAWVEVYFDGFGWVTFEPSPYFAEKYYNISMNDYRDNKIIFDKNGEERDAPEEKDDEKDPSDSDITYNKDDEKAEINENDVVFVMLNIDVTRRTLMMAVNALLLAMIIVMLLLILQGSAKLFVLLPLASYGLLAVLGYKLLVAANICLAVIFIMCVLAKLAIKRRKRQLRRMYSFDNRQFIFTAWYEIKRLAKYDGNRIKQDETPADFLARLGEAYGSDIVPAAAQSVNRLLYGRGRATAITDDDRAYVAVAYEQIEAAVKSKHKKLYFDFCRYILHII